MQVTRYHHCEHGDCNSIPSPFVAFDQTFCTRCIILHVAVGPLVYWSDNVPTSARRRRFQVDHDFLKKSADCSCFFIFLQLCSKTLFFLSWAVKAMAFDGVIVLLSVVDLVNDFASGAGPVGSDLLQ